MHKKGKDQYIIRGVGNYQICVLKNNGNHSFVVPLNLMQKDKIISSSKNKFLVLRHAVIEDKNFLNFVFNSNQDIYVDIYSNHEVQIFNNIDNVYRAESKFKGKIKYISIENSLDNTSRYKIIIELSESKLFYNVNKLK